jgi:hypothetical protein
MTTATKPLRAFHGDPALQAERVARMEAHIKMDQLVQGTGFEPDTGRGCFVGCTCDRYEPGIFPEEIGYPAELQDLLDAIHEGLPPEDTPRYALAYLRDVTPGADLTRVHHAFFAWLLVDGHVFPVPEAPAVAAACDRVAALHRRASAGEAIPAEEWAASAASGASAACAARAAKAASAGSAASAAWASCAVSAAWAARASCAVSAAWAARAVRDAWDTSPAWAARAVRDAWDTSPAWAASAARASCAVSAAWAVRDASAACAASAAWAAAWRAMAAKLLELMAGAPVPEEEERP